MCIYISIQVYRIKQFLMKDCFKVYMIWQQIFLTLLCLLLLYIIHISMREMKQNGINKTLSWWILKTNRNRKQYKANKQKKKKSENSFCLYFPSHIYIRPTQVIGLIVGFKLQDFSITFYILGAGTLLACIVRGKQ